METFVAGIMFPNTYHGGGSKTLLFIGLLSIFPYFNLNILIDTFYFDLCVHLASNSNNKLYVTICNCILPLGGCYET